MTSREKALAASQQALQGCPHVVGACTAPKTTAGRVTGQDAVVVLVDRKAPRHTLARDELVPAWIAGWPTDVVEAALQPLATGGHLRPVCVGDAIGGESLGARCTAGLLYYLQGALYMLTAAHGVMANAADNPVGRPVTQPPGAGLYDRLPNGELGPNQLAIGTVERWASPFDGVTDAASIRLPDSAPDPRRPAWGWNMPASTMLRIVDQFQAMARAGRCPPAPITGFPLHRSDVDAAIRRDPQAHLTLDNVYLSYITGLAQAGLGETVWKSGAKTGVTTMRVWATDLQVWTTYFGQPVALQGLIAMTCAVGGVAGGDSGAVVVNPRNKAVGMLIMGSQELGVATPIGVTLRALHTPEELLGVELGAPA